MLKQGYFPVRWALGLDEGFGVPIFNYTYPGPYYIVGGLMFLGFTVTTATKILLLGSYVLGGVSFFLIFRRKNKWLAVVAALLYLNTPYQFLDMFVRNALGEVVVLGLMPLAWLMMEDIKKRKSLKIYHPIPLFLLLISHSFLGILFLAFIAAYFVWQRTIDKNIWKCIFLSLGLAAFFLVPMIFEKNLITSGKTSNYTFDYREHFVYPAQLLYGKWDYWYSNPGPNDGISFQLGIANILVLVIGLFLLLFKKIPLDSEIIFYYLALILAIFLMLPVSSLLWEKIKVLQVMQFPWRFLFLITYLVPLIFLKIFGSFKNKTWIFLVTIFILLVSFYNTRNYRRPMEFWSPNNLNYKGYYDLYRNGTTTASRGEVTPIWSTKIHYPIDDNIKKFKFSIDSTVSNNIVKIGYNYFPSWNLKSEGNDVELMPGDSGILTFRPLIGKHDYVLKLGETLIEKISDGISLLSLLWLVGGGWARRRWLGYNGSR